MGYPGILTTRPLQISTLGTVAQPYSFRLAWNPPGNPALAEGHPLAMLALGEFNCGSRSVTNPR